MEGEEKSEEGREREREKRQRGREEEKERENEKKKGRGLSFSSLACKELGSYQFHLDNKKTGEQTEKQLFLDPPEN